MARLDRPRTMLEALFEHPLIGSDNGEQGIGPTLGESVGSPAMTPGRAGSEARAFATRRRVLISTTARAPLGSEIARALYGRRLGAPDRPAPDQPPTAPTKDADDGL